MNILGPEGRIVGWKAQEEHRIQMQICQQWEGGRIYCSEMIAPSSFVSVQPQLLVSLAAVCLLNVELLNLHQPGKSALLSLN